MDKYLSNGTNNDRALDCGAGIGRIAKHLLLPRFKQIDLIEPSKAQLDQARVDFAMNKAVDKYYEVGLQDFKFEKTYDVIWVQWALCYLTDDDLVKFLENCRENLTSKENSLIFIKENVSDNIPAYDE